MTNSPYKGMKKEEIIKINPKWKNCGFKKGILPKNWNVFKKGNQYAKGNKPNSTSFKKGHIPWNSEKHYTNIKLKGNQYGKKNKGIPKSNKTKEKFRIAAQKRILRMFGGPNIGLNEKRILKEIELSNNIKFIKQFPINGYFVDGYNKKLNLVVEVDEKPKTSKREKERENYIKKKLNCKFIRIKDY